MGDKTAENLAIRRRSYQDDDRHVQRGIARAGDNGAVMPRRYNPISPALAASIDALDRGSRKSAATADVWSATAARSVAHY